MKYNHIDMAAPLKFMWRCCNMWVLRRRNIWASPFAKWNGHTRFGGFNVVHSGACVSSSELGRYTYVNQESYLPECRIGSFCSIGKNVRVVRFTHPTKDVVSTSPVFYSTRLQCGKTFARSQDYCEQKRIDGFSLVIGNDVWIGEGARIIEGVRIGNGAVVAAYSLVTGDVPPYAIVGGVPAKVIRFRFEEEICRQVSDSAWWNRSDEWIAAHADEFSDVSTFLSNVDS